MGIASSDGNKISGMTGFERRWKPSNEQDVFITRL